MSRSKVIFVVVLLLLAASAVAIFEFWPQKYVLGTSLTETITLWNDREAFVFLDLRTTGRAQNVFQEKLSHTKYAYLAVLTGNYVGFIKDDVVAYHLTPNGKLDRFALPEHTQLYGAWSLVNGRLRLTPTPYSIENSQTQRNLGFQWDGAKFATVSAAPEPPVPAATQKLSADDDEDEGTDYQFLNKTAKQQFKAAGWHYKLLFSYSTGATLPVGLAGNDFDLTIENSKPQTGNFDLLLYSAKTLQLSGEKLGSAPVVLWSQSGLKSVSKNEYEDLARRYGAQYKRPFAWTWITLLLFIVLWRYGSLLHVAFSFLTMKRRVLKKMATFYSFPAATPAQFPALDVQTLERCTGELEGLGFVRLLDFSLASDSPNTPPNFCRLLAQSRHHCFGVVMQIFPRGKSPMPVRCSFEGSLQDGWTLAFSNGKPIAAGSLLRRKKALGVSMPDVTTSELLQAFLKMREQVCLDLGISAVNDDTLEAFINQRRRAATEHREAAQQKNFAKGLLEYYLHKFSLRKTKPEYLWLGDYPKEAERRKQGLSNFAAVGR